MARTPMPKAGQILHLTAWKDVRQFVAARAGHRCQHCRCFTGINGEADHITPRRVLAATGGNPLEPTNLQWLCQPCHARKSATERWAGHTPTKRSILRRSRVKGRKTFLLAAGLSPADIIN